ncbi:putative ferric-chelate reductase 1 homolog [Tachypleus tridentatus]|uniref:putative ferric-chelate reductase 1 homolog n=1 Tax=Tachypleus tridentatus TaxID=6853 RepID=UPI003FD5E96C
MVNVVFGVVIICVIATTCFLPKCSTLNSGDQPQACKNIIPKHGESPQQSPSPYILSGKIKPGSNGDVVQVTLSASEGERFKGFLLQAHLKDDPSHIIEGSFIENDMSLVINCNTEKSAVTHKNTKEKRKFTTTWMPPANFNGEVVFRGTVLKDFKTFWINIDSPPLSIVGPSPQPVRKPAPSVNLYSDCESQKKSCFGMPSLCIRDKSCSVILVYIYKEGEVEFEMTGALGSSNKYIAVGMSEDNKMGDDSVTECVLLNEKVIVRQSWNIPSTYNNEILKEPMEIYDQSGHYVDGVMTCRWKSKPLTTVKNTIHNIVNQNYHLLLAKGPASSDGVKRKHSERAVSNKPVNLTLVSVVAGAKVPLFIKLHGSLMVAAWIGFASLAILMARHYKQVWQANTLCTVKIWFAIHRFLMLLSLSLMIAGFVLIFLHVQGWSQVAPNPHPILGCVATGLALLQPIMAMLRPKPDARKRPIFNWLHWFVGNAAKIVAVLTIFFAVSLQAANLPYAYYWILVGYVAFYFLFHLIMQLHACIMDRKKGTEIGMQELNGEERDSPKDAPGSNFRRFMLGIYIVIVAGLVTALVLLIWL